MTAKQAIVPNRRQARQFSTSAEIVAALGGTSAVAEALGLVPSAVSQWKRAGIPPARWVALESLARALAVPGITVASLSALAPPPAGLAAPSAEARP